MKALHLEAAAWCFLVGALVLVASACPPVTPPVTPPPDAADAIAPIVTVMDAAPPMADAAPAPPPPSGCDAACAAMQKAGCVVLSTCGTAMCAANADPRFKHYNVACLTRAKTVADVKACGADCTPPPP